MLLELIFYFVISSHYGYKGNPNFTTLFLKRRCFFDVVFCHIKT